jgi:hypothetical protein
MSRSPVLRAPLEPDVESTVHPPLSCSTSLLQAPELLPRLELVSFVPMRLNLRGGSRTSGVISGSRSGHRYG